MDTMRKLLIALLFACTVAIAHATPFFTSLLPGAQQVGQGVFKRFGWSIYEATLYAPGGRFDPNKPYALSLTYERTIAGDRLVQASLDEMRKLGAPIDERPDWGPALSKVLPSVSKGVTLTGVYRPGEGATFYQQDREIGKVDDALARMFFAIWLDPRTSDPGLRQALLGVTQ
ncbi:chalcone isomerase family protein [Zwartia vadi]|uniref:chalcone isomerase family protein n=1 Tax=Zwartia vadi TaxID=3058168 RepID=UPI0025B52CE3|nr:chalcone isomerase family protein [Zwartia vadi]MDN3988015.1 chalcone isomerase family protein [Zwartia vadi]